MAPDPPSEASDEEDGRQVVLDDDVWLSLSSPLRADIVAWGELFHGYFRSSDGWADLEVHRQYRDQAPLLAERIRTEVGEDYRAEVSSWMERD